MVIPTRSSPPRTRRRANLKRSPSPDYASVGDIDTEMPDIDPEPPQKFAFIVALDYGTTYTSVSYFKFDPDDRPNDVNIPEIQTIQAWPHACGGTKASNKAEVPSESWYANGQHYWGFQALKERRKPSFRRDSAVGLGFCPKNVLSGNDEDENSRLELKNTLATIGKKETDIVTDYLMQVLLHTKRELRDIEGYNEICDVELVLCVPAAWDATARRDWQEIMGEVSERAQFGSIYNFWMIHEPEAAAAMVLESETRLGTGVTRIKWNKGDTFIVCDAGGGTVDTITYRIESMFPIRLSEVTSPKGNHWGSKYINDALQRKVLSILQDETYLETDGKTLRDIVNRSVMYQFETETKEGFRNEEDEVFEIDGLRENPEKQFERSQLKVSRSTIADCFNPSINGVIALIESQLKAANKALDKASESRRGELKRVLLVGGFGNSLMLQESLRARLPHGMRLACDLRKDLSQMVSRGAVLRAVNKKNGPRRQMYSSYGFLQQEQFNPKIHTNGECVTNNPADGKAYVCNVICWLIKKKQKLDNVHFFTCNSYRVFEEEQSWILYETVYVSDFEVRNHLQYNYGSNRNAVVTGRIRVDLNFLKDQGLIQATRRTPDSPWYWEVEYDLVMEVEGLNLRTYARWPRGGDIRGQAHQISIAAAFKPGTA